MLMSYDECLASFLFAKNQTIATTFLMNSSPFPSVAAFVFTVEFLFGMKWLHEKNFLKYTMSSIKNPAIMSGNCLVYQSTDLPTDSPTLAK